MRSRRAFTLVELLVVIGIIAILVGMLLPTLSRVNATAASTKCQANLRSIGQAMFIYANENRGQLPRGMVSAIENFAVEQRDALARILKVPVQEKTSDPKVTAGSPASIFFCPSNQIRPWTPDDFVSADSTTRGRMLYWYVGNPWDPTLPTSSPSPNPDVQAHWQFYDMSLPTPAASGTTPGSMTRAGRDYVRSTKDKGAANVIVMTDQSRQLTAGWFTVHGISDLFSKKRGGWKNSLYGDNHVQALRSDEMKARWGRANPAAW